MKMVILAAVIAGLVFQGCGKDTSSGAPSATPTPVAQKQQVCQPTPGLPLRICTGLYPGSVPSGQLVCNGGPTCVAP
jgi:hypothetical protein